MKTTIESIFLLGGLLISSASAQNPVTNLPHEAKCWNIPYTPTSISAAATAAHTLRLATVHEFPMAYPLTNLRYPTWEHQGSVFPASGAPWAKGCDTSSLHKFPLVPQSLAGKGGAWDGTKSRSSDVGGGHSQSDFVFVDGEGRFCMVATEDPFGVRGWLPCWWE